MLAALALTVQVADVTLVIAGALVTLAYVVWLTREGRWQDPLAGALLPQRAPSVLSAILLAVAFFFVPVLLLSAMMKGQAAAALTNPGSDAWHRAQTVDAAAKCGLSLLMIVLLTRTGALKTTRGWALVRGVGAGFVGFMVVVPVLTLQLKATTVIWEWVAPTEIPPEHPVLLALPTSAWGPWGLVQLLVGAIVVAPLAEELLFRGILLEAFCGHLQARWTGIVTAAVAFGWVHSAQPQAVLPMATFGVLLGYLRLRTGSLWPCIVVHMLFNARTIVFKLLVPDVPPVT